MKWVRCFLILSSHTSPDKFNYLIFSLELETINVICIKFNTFEYHVFAPMHSVLSKKLAKSLKTKIIVMCLGP